MNLVLARPTYGSLDPRVVAAQMGAVMYAGNHGVRWVGGVARDRELIDTSRNNLVRDVIQDKDVEAIMWLDSDMLVGPQDIAKLANAAEQHGLDFVTGNYFQRLPPHHPLVGRFKGTAGIEPFDPRELTPNTLYPAEGCGFGCVLTTLRMFRAMSDPWFRWKQRDGLGEDYDFCYSAMKAGFKLWLHPDVKPGHVGLGEIVTQEHFEKRAQ